MTATGIGPSISDGSRIRTSPAGRSLRTYIERSRHHLYPRERTKPCVWQFGRRSAGRLSRQVSSHSYSRISRIRPSTGASVSSWSESSYSSHAGSIDRDSTQRLTRTYHCTVENAGKTSKIRFYRLNAGVQWVAGTTNSLWVSIILDRADFLDKVRQ